MVRKVSRFIYWTPRILTILFIIFLAMFSLDVITPGATAEQIAMGLLMHNLPVLALIIVLIVSWKYEIVGGITFIIAGVIYIILVYNGNVPWYLVLGWSLTISGPAFLIGFLFMINWYKKKSD